MTQRKTEVGLLAFSLSAYFVLFPEGQVGKETGVAVHIQLPITLNHLCAAIVFSKEPFKK